MNFDKLFEQTDNSIKIEFLKSILASDKALRKKFLEYIPAITPDIPARNLNITEFSNKVLLAYKEFTESMEALNLEDFLIALINKISDKGAIPILAKICESNSKS